MLLAIDTATAQTGLACYDATGVLAECSWHSGRDHTVQLLPQLDLLLRHLNRSPGDITVVAVALGPGSWSGLRVGMSVAKGFALAREVALVGIGTLDALAYQHETPDTPVRSIIRLGRDRYATALFQHTPAAPYQCEARNLSLDQLVNADHGPTMYCGDLDPDLHAALVEAYGDNALFPRPAAALRRVGFLAELAFRRVLAHDYDDRATLEPIYLGQPVKSERAG